MNKLPKARTKDLVVQNSGNELLIYNRANDRAFCLNETSAKIFNACDGRVTFAELREKHKLTDEIIYLALDELRIQDLIEPDYASPFAGLSRREVVKKVGLASMIALPLITSIVAPSAANAASQGANPPAAANACVPLNVCYRAGTLLCPTGCNEIITFDTYLNPDNRCGALYDTGGTIDCSTPGRQGPGSFAGLNFIRTA